MPFKSRSQQRFMYARHPKMAAEMADKMTPGAFKRLPEKVRMRAMKRKAKHS